MLSLFFVLAAGAIGCGSSGAGTSTSSASSEARTSPSAVAGRTSTATSAPEDPAATVSFARDASTICKKVDVELTKTVAANITPHELARVAPEHAAIEQRAADQLAKLQPPASVASWWRKVTSYRHTLAVELSELAEAAKRGDSNRIKTLSASKLRTHKKLSEAAARAKVLDCGKPVAVGQR